VSLWFLETILQITTSRLRSLLQRLIFSWDDIQSFHKLSKSWQCRCGETCSVCSVTTTRTSNSQVQNFLFLSGKWSAVSPYSGCVNSSSFCCCLRKVSMHCCTILEIVFITQPGLSSSLSLPTPVSASLSSSSSPVFSSSEHTRLVKLFLIWFNIPSNGISGFLVVNRTFSAYLISSFSCGITVSVSSTHFLATAASLSGWSSIHFSLCSLLNKRVSHLFSTPNFNMDHKPCNAPRAWTLSAYKPFLTEYISWRGHADCVVDLLYFPTWTGQWFVFRELTFVFCVDFVVRRDFGCCMMWTAWMQAASFMSRLVCLINLNKAKSGFWPSLLWE